MPARSSKPRPLSTVLIANRGEIAVRIARACRDAGLRTVAVYADPDRDALHTQIADEAYALGGTTAASSYLVVDKILDIAKRSGADAIHPGYGFLSERSDFAQAVTDAGLTWIGPPPVGHREARRQGLGTSHRPEGRRSAGRRHQGPRPELRRGRRLRREHGLPIAIKAAFGGGGRGLKVAREESEVARAVRLRGARGGLRLRSRRVLRGALPGLAPGTSRPSAWPTCTATSRWSPPVTARSSAATRSSSRRPPRPSSPPSRTRSWCQLLQGDPARGRICRRRHLRVPGGHRRHHLVPRGQHPSPGRAHRSPRRSPAWTWCASSCASPPASTISSEQDPDVARTLLRVPDQRRGPGPRLHARPRAHPPLRDALRPWRARRHRRARG